MHCISGEILVAASALGLKVLDTGNEYIVETKDGFYITGGRTGIRLAPSSEGYSLSWGRGEAIVTRNPCEALILAYNLASDNARRKNNSRSTRIVERLRAYTPSSACEKWISRATGIAASGSLPQVLCRLSPLILALYEQGEGRNPLLAQASSEIAYFIEGASRIEEVRSIADWVRRLLPDHTVTLHSRLLHATIAGITGVNVWGLLLASYHASKHCAAGRVVVRDPHPASLIAGSELAWILNASLETSPSPIVKLLAVFAVPLDYYAGREESSTIRVCNGLCRIPYLMLGDNILQRIFESYTEGIGGVIYLENGEPVSSLLGVGRELASVDATGVHSSAQAILRAMRAVEEPVSTSSLTSKLIS